MVRIMSSTGLEVFDRTVQETNIWLGEIAEDLGPDRQVAYRVLRAVLHALRDRLTVEQAAHLSAQLPRMLVWRSSTACAGTSLLANWKRCSGRCRTRCVRSSARPKQRKEEREMA